MRLLFCVPLCAGGRRVVPIVVGLLLLVGLPAGAQDYTVEEATLDGGGGRVTSGDRALTSSLSSSPVGTVETDRYVLYSGTPSPFLGQAAILILHEPGDAGRAERGQPKDLTVRIVTNGPPLRSASLSYRSGGRGTVTTVDLTATDGGYEATIPGSALGEEGLTYFFTAVNERGTEVRAPQQGVYSLPVYVGGDGLLRTEGLPAGATQSAYRLLSVPIDLEDPSPEAVLGDDVPALAGASAYDPSEARLFEPIGSRLAEFPNTGDFRRGAPFWVLVRDGVDTLDTGAGTVPALDAPVEVELESGWNFIGTPFTTPVPTSNLETESGEDLTLRSYGSNGYNTPDAPVEEMMPFEGYAVFVETATTVTIEPPVDAPESAAAGTEERAVGGEATNAEETPFPWHLRVRGTASHGRDLNATAAVHPEAREGWDDRDWLDPPSVGGALRISFEAPAGAPGESGLSADVRRPPAQGTTWPLTVASDSAGTVQVSVDGVRRIPDRFEPWLVDATTKESWNLRDDATARLEMLSDGAERPMRLVVGTRDYVQEALETLEAVPLTYALEPPVPNPSAGAVALRLEIPEEDRVTLAVYNVLGQRVATLRDEVPMAAGFHTVVWEPSHLASGMYFVRMEAGNHRETKKLVRVQ